MCVCVCVCMCVCVFVCVCVCLCMCVCVYVSVWTSCAHESIHMHDGVPVVRVCRGGLGGNTSVFFGVELEFFSGIFALSSTARSAIDCVKMINDEHFISGSQDGYVCTAVCVCVF